MTNGQKAFAVVAALGFSALLYKSHRRGRHNRGVRREARAMRARGCRNVRAYHLPGEKRPGTRFGFRPDVDGLCPTSSGRWREEVVEVETSESVGSTHTRQQVAAFKRSARLRGGQFRLVVER